MSDVRLGWEPAEAVVANARESNQRFDMSFPKDIGEHGMLLKFSKYKFGSLGSITGENIGSILLPIPSNIRESYSVEIGPTGIGLGGMLGAEALNSAVDVNSVLNSFANTGPTSLTSDPAAAANYFMKSGLASTVAGAVGGLAGGVGGAVLGTLAGQGAAGSALGDALALSSGTALNPHTTVMFRGMNLRSHNFEWTFSPKSQSEGEILRKIIRSVKRNTLPSYQSAGGQPSGTALDRVLLRYPSVVDISFVGLDQSYFFGFKTCMITQVEVDYSQNGNAFFAGPAGAKPVMIRFAINLMESKIHTAEDFDAGA
jgi:hypothetical protein